MLTYPPMNTQEYHDEFWMAEALSLARHAEQQGEIPVGAVIVANDKLIAQGWNQPIMACDPTAHAEVVALRQAAHAVNNYRVVNTTLYVTLEPCAMCVGALVQGRIARLVFGAFDLRAGAVKSVFEILAAKQLNHRIEWQGGVLEESCSSLLKSFFKKKRQK